MPNFRNLAPSIAVAVLASFSSGQIIGMPAGARQWIELGANWVAPGTCCDEAVGGVGSIPYPSPNYIGDPAYPSGSSAYGTAASSANQLRSSYSVHWTTGSAFLYNSLVDTYTISGPPGTNGTPVGARVVMRVTGTLFVPATLTNGLHLGGSYAHIEVGTWNPSTDPALSEQFRVYAFDTINFVQYASIPSANYGTITPTLDVDMVIDQVLTRNVGTPFDVAFGLNTSGPGAGNISHSPAPAPSEYLIATIDWILPAGYQISSTLGWTDPNAAVNYCTAGTTTNGCTAIMSASGAPSVAATSGFVLSAAGVEGQKLGLIYYGISGRHASVWNPGSTSFLCVKSPVQRTPAQSSGGTVDACDGTLALDLLAYLATHPSALGQPFSAGDVCDAQAWFRDPSAPGTTNLTDGIEWSMEP